MSDFIFRGARGGAQAGPPCGPAQAREGPALQFGKVPGSPGPRSGGDVPVRPLVRPLPPPLRLQTQPLITTTLPTAGPPAELCRPDLVGVGVNFPRNGLVSHPPAQEVAASCPAPPADHWASIRTTEKEPFTRDLRAVGAPLPGPRGEPARWGGRVAGQQRTPRPLTGLWECQGRDKGCMPLGRERRPSGDGVGEEVPRRGSVGSLRSFVRLQLRRGQAGPRSLPGLGGPGPRAGPSQVLSGQGVSQEAGRSSCGPHPT